MSPPPAGSQSALPGFASAEPTDRLFFAVQPDAATAARIAALAATLRDRHGLRGKPLAAERLHVTLHHLGDYAGLPNDVVRAASAAAADVAGAAFEARFERAQSFAARGSRKPFVLLGEEGVASLIALQRSLGEALRTHGLARWVAPQFTPHVTLLYDDTAVAAQAIEAIGWRVDQIVLVHSLLGQSRHIPLAHWPLRG